MCIKDMTSDTSYTAVLKMTADGNLHINAQVHALLLSQRLSHTMRHGIRRRSEIFHID